MPRLTRILSLLPFILPGFLPASPSLDHARQARALLGDETWSRVVRIENANRSSVYPSELYALVFELGGLLWFYTDADGTQSLSLHRHRLAAEKANLAPLLQAIEPGFVVHEIVPEEQARPLVVAEAPPNACLLESHALLRRRQAAGEPILHARLLSYYIPQRRAGHTVLYYETPRGAFVIDPDRPRKRVRVRKAAHDDPRTLAEAIRPRLQISGARWIPASAAPGETRLATAGSPLKRAWLQQERGPD